MSLGSEWSIMSRRARLVTVGWVFLWFDLAAFGAILAGASPLAVLAIGAVTALIGFGVGAFLLKRYGRRYLAYLKRRRPLGPR